MIVLQIFILFLPLLLLAEANFGTGPFHRTPPASIPSDSPTISSNLPENQQIPSPPQLPHLNQQPSVHVEPVTAVLRRSSSKFPNPSVNIQKASQPNTPPLVHVEPVTPIATEKSGSVDPTTSPATSEPDSTIEIQSPESAVVQNPYSFHTENINQNSSPYHVIQPASSLWSPPKFSTLAVNRHEASQPNTVESVDVDPVTSVTTENSVSVDPATLPPKIYSDSPKEIKTPKPRLVQPPPYHVPRPVLSPRSPPKIPTPSLNIHTVSQPNIVESVHVEPAIVVTPEKSVSVEPTTLPQTIKTDSPVEIQTPKPGVLQAPPAFHRDNFHRGSVRPHHVPNSPYPEHPNFILRLAPTSEPDSTIEIQSPESAVVQNPYSFHTENINQNSSPYHVIQPASSLWSPPKFSTLAINRHEASQPNTVESVDMDPVTSVTTENSVSVDPATLPPKIYSDSPKEIKTPKPRLVQPPPYHVPRPVLSPRSPPKIPTPSLNIHTVSQPNIVESVHVEPAIVVTPEKSVSVEPTTLPQTIKTDSPVEIQTPKPGVLQAPPAFHRDNFHRGSVRPHHVPNSPHPEHPNFILRLAPTSEPDSTIEIQSPESAVVQNPYSFHTENINQNSSPYHVIQPASSLWSPPKFSTLAVNRHEASQPNTVESVDVDPDTSVTTENSVSVDPATLPPKIYSDSPKEIKTPKPRLVQPPSYHVPRPVLSPGSPPKIPTPSLNIHTVSQPNIVESVHVEPAIVVTPEKSVSVEPTTLPQTIKTDSPVEIQTPKPGVLQAPPAFHRDNFDRGSVRPHHVPNSPHPEHPNFILRLAPIPTFPNKPSTNSSEEILSLSQPVYIDKINHKDIGPYHRSQRSTDPWDQQISNSFEEDQISQNNIPPPALSTERPGSNLRRFKCPQANGYFKYTNHCGEYIECKNYIPLAYTCPVGLYFNPQAEWTEYPCEDPSNVQCDEETIPLRTTSSPPAKTPPPNVETTPHPTNQKNVFVCPQPHGYFKFNDQCEQYIECKNYVALMFSCPPGLHFNPRAQWTEYPCEDPSIVQCDSDAADEKPPRPTEAHTTTPIPALPTTRPPPPPTTRPPPPPPIPRSPPPPHTSRLPPPPPTTRRPPPPPPTTWQPPPPPSKRRPPPPPSMTWRPKQPPTTRRPALPKTRHTPPPPTTRPPTPPPTTTPLPVIIPKNLPDHNICRQQFGYFKISDRCNEYLECKNYVPLIFTCPVGLHFNPLADWTEYPCDLPSKVQCNEEPVDPKVPSTTQPPLAIITQLPVVKPQPGRKLPDFKCPEANGYFKHNDKCSEYIECKNYVPLAYTCPSGLHFNVFAKWTEYPCDQPSKVQCNTESGTNQPTENPNVTSRPVVPLLPTIATPEPTDVTQSPTAVTPYIPRFPTQETVRPSTERPSFELFDYYCQEPNGYYAVASQCDIYIECQGFKAVKRYCPAGLHFDSKAQWPKFPCDYPSFVQCDKEAGTKQPTKYPNVTPRPTEGTKQPAVVTPRPTVATPRSTVVTPSLPHFPTQGIVYPPTPSPSRHPVIPPRPTTVTQSPTAVTPYIPRFPTQETVRPSTERPSFELFDYYCQDPNGYYAVASQCDTYIECKEYNAIQHFCPAGLYFNPKVQWPNFPCDYRSRVQCKNESVNDDSITRPDIGIHRPNFGFLRPTIGTPRPTIVTSRRPTGHYVTRLSRQQTVKPSPSKLPSNYSCPESNGFYSVASQCDVYVECKNGKATEHTCPDGLLFKTNTHWPDYPCVYPSEVTCSSGDVVQQPSPTAECPHREGFFPTDSGDCGEYKVCSAGIATIKHCPPGLVFNFDKLNTCDWPINVPACNRSRALEGFECPSLPVNENTLHVHKYRYGRSCKNFIACQKGHPRLLTCDAGLHFNEQTESCVDSDLVVDCDA